MPSKTPAKIAKNDQNAFRRITLPDRPCGCGCGQIFTPERDWQKYINDIHRKVAFKKKHQIDHDKIVQIRHHLEAINGILETL